MSSRFFGSLVMTAALTGFSGTAAAQVICYESLIGASVGIGDDVVLGIQPIGFAFPFNGVTYTDIHPCTNGFVYLSNAAVPAPGGALCCTGTTAALVAGSPKICTRFDDLNILAANAAGVHVNQLPGKCVITWKNVVEYANTVTFEIQCQLYATGEIVFFYGPNVTARTTGDALVGMSEANAAAVPATSDFSAGGATPTPTCFQLFNNTLLPWDLASNSILFVPAGPGYVFFMMACGATHEASGAACYDIAGSVYEDFPANTFDLSGQTLSMFPAGGGYTWLSLPLTSWFAPVAAPLVLTDDSLSPSIPLPTSFPYAGGVSTAIVVHSNGQIFLGSGAAADYSPTPAELLARGPSIGAWVDLNPGVAGSGQVVVDFDAINNLCIVTYNGVYAFGTVLPQTFQIVMSLSGSAGPGNVELRFQSLANVATLATNMILAYTPGTTLRDPGNRDFSALMPFTSPAESPALALSAAPIPLLGTTFTYTISNIPATAIASALILSLGQIPAPGLDLTFLGAAGCWQHIDLSTSASVLLFGGPTASSPFTVPTGPAWLGFNLFGQGASLVPGANPLSVITSNGLRSQFF